MSSLVSDPETERSRIRDSNHLKGRDRTERSRSVSISQIVDIRSRPVHPYPEGLRIGRRFEVDAHEMAGILERERRKECGADHAEYADVRGEHHGQHRDRSQRKARGVRQRSTGVLHVLTRTVYPRERPSVAMMFLRLQDPAETAQRGSTGVSWREAAG